MSEIGLIEAVNSIPNYYDAAANALRFPDGFLTPGALVALVSFAKAKRVSRDKVTLPENTRGYTSAIGLARALWGKDDYQHERKQEGKNYSPLEHLNNPEATDAATSRINSCIRRFVGDELPANFVSMLCEVVGVLHENVWSHAKASGFSTAQKWAVSWTLRRDHHLEFALADSGLGFLSEMRRVGMQVDSHREAIAWCIQEGHSTKLLKPEAIWAQRVPEDLIGNPLRGVEHTRISDNHHMGLGLYKLTQLVKEFRGRLWLASGDTSLALAPGHENAYISLKYPWQGVAIACRFQASQIKRAGREIETADKDIEQIMRVLGGHRG